MFNNVDVFADELKRKVQDGRSYLDARLYAYHLVRELGVTFDLFATDQRHASNRAYAWVQAKPWDGVDRIQSLFETLRLPSGITDDMRARYREYLVTWLRDACMLLEPPDVRETTGRVYQQQHMLVLEGPEGCGKTSWVNQLVGPDVYQRMDFIHNDATLTPSKENTWRLTSKWITEVTAIAPGFDGVALKHLINLACDESGPRVKLKIWRERRSVFIATSRESLVTRAQRSWRVAQIPVVACLVARTPGHPGPCMEDIDMQQLWAQVYAQVKAGDISYKMEAFQDDPKAWPTAQFPAHLRIKEAAEDRILSYKQAAEESVAENVQRLFGPAAPNSSKSSWVSGDEARVHYFRYALGAYSAANPQRVWQEVSRELQKQWGPCVKISVMRYPVHLIHPDGSSA
jgi:hypothetical protein